MDVDVSYQEGEYSSLNSSSCYFTAEESPPQLSPFQDNSFKSMVVAELECPICLNMMVGEYRQPLLCSNGHPCCSYCRSRVDSCPSCRSTESWSRCLPMERMGSWVVQRGIVTEPGPPTLPSTPMRDMRAFFDRTTLPRTYRGRGQHFGSERRIFGTYPESFDAHSSRRVEVLDSASVSDTSSSHSVMLDMSPIVNHNPALLQLLRRPSTSPPSISTPLSTMAPLWLGSSTPSSLTPTPRESPEVST